MTADTRHADAEIENARSIAYGLIASVLSYPDSESLHALADSLCGCRAGELLKRAFPALAGRFEAISKALARLANIESNEAATVQNVYTELFGHAVRGTCPLYELEYRHSDILQQASELADISGFYQAFGMELVRESHERADHVTVQCEFMSVLAAKQAYALETSNDEARQVLHDAQRSFLTDHMSKWLPAFCSRVQQADPDGFYGEVAAFLGELNKAESNRFGVAYGPEYLELRPADMQRDTAFQCGIEESCPGSTPGSTPASTTGGPEPLVQLGIDRK